MDYKKIYLEKIKPELTDEQKQSPYAHLYDLPMKEPAKKIMEALTGETMDENLALDFDSLYKMFEKDEMPKDNGWCIRKDKTGYSSIRTILPDVTPELLKKWYGWFKNDDYDYLNYKIWMPGWHKSHANPLIEDVGWGNIEIHSDGFSDHTILNLPDEPQKMDSNFLHAIVSSGYCFPEGKQDEEPMWNTIVKVYKRNGNGIEILGLNYIGLKIENNSFIKIHDADPEKVRLFAIHGAYESQRMNELIPRIFNEEGEV